MIFRRFPLIACILFVAAQCQQATADQFRDEMMRLAERILATTKQQPVQVGVFSPTGLPKTNVGPGFEGVLAQCLNKLRPGSVQPEAKYEVKGDYLFAKARELPKLSRVVKVNARLIDLEFGEELNRTPMKMMLDHTKTIAAVLQECMHLPPDGSKEERNRAMANAIEAPEAHLEGQQSTLISSHPDSPFAIEVLVKPVQSPPGSRAMPRGVRLDGGRPFVDIEENEVYEIKAYNNSDYEVAVRLFIDGLDMYHFSQDRKADGTPRYTHAIIKPRSAARLIGWHNSVQGDTNYLSFLVTSYGKGAVSYAGIPSRGSVGVIHAQFSFSRPLQPGARAAAGKETGFGPPRTVRQNPLRREIDPPHDFVSVRYAREEPTAPELGPLGSEQPKNADGPQAPLQKPQ